MRQAFFEYIGNKDSLVGYQRSNRLILLKTFLALCDKTGKALVCDVVNGYSSFYQTRKENGLVTDMGADVVIENIENSTQSEVLSVIKRHPYRVLNEKGFLAISRINNQDYFVLNEILNTSLSEKDISDIKLLLEQKINLYYSKIDINKSDPETEAENNYISEQRIESTFSENCYLEFREYCKESNIVFTSEIEPIDFVAFRSRTGTTFEFVNEIKKRVVQINNGEFIPVNIKKESLNIDIVPGCEDVPTIKNYSDNKLEIYDEYPQLAEDKEAYADKGVPISDVLTDRIFQSFNQFCIEHNIKYIKDLDGFDFNRLLEVKGFGEKRIKNIIREYNDVVGANSLEDKALIQCKKLLTSNRMRSYIEQLINLNNDVEKSDQFTNEELEILDKFTIALDVLGVEICRMAYLNPLNITLITNALDAFAADVIIEVERVEELYNVFKKISKANEDKKVYPLIMAYTADVAKSKKLIDVFANCSSVAELTIEFKNVSKDYVIYVEVINFLEWLQTDLMKSIINSYLDIFKKDSYKEIINCRANGGTLETAGQILGVTRERVRQIEKKVQLKFDHQNSRKRFMWTIAAFIGSNTIIDKQDLINYMGENATGFVYLLINSTSKYYCYSEKLNAFIVGIQLDFDKLKEFIDTLTLPDIIFSTDMDRFIEKVVIQFCVPIELARMMVLLDYKSTGLIYHKRKISLTDMYKIILKKHYPSGAKLFDKSEQERFRRYIVEMFGNVKLPINYRALDARVADIGVLCDRGTYIHSDYIKINIELMNEIREYVKNGERLSYSFLELFEYFKEKLLSNSNINNRYFLQGVLKYYFKADFYFNRDMISKSEEIERIDEQIEEFIGRYDIVTKEQLRNEFSGVTEAMLFFAVGRCKNVIAVENGTYMHTMHLNIYESDYEISKIIDYCTEDMPVSTRKLLEVLYSTHTEFLNRNFIFSHIKLFSILQYMMKDKYKFSRPFIARQEVEYITRTGVIKNYLKGKEFYEISELIEFCEEYHLSFLSWATLFEDLSDEFIRADSNLCVNIEQIDIDEEKVETVKNILKDVIKQKGYISARKIKDFMFFPEIGIEWNGYLLRSIIDKYISDIEVLPIPTSDSYLLSVIFLNETCDYDSYEDFLRCVVKSEQHSSPFKDLNEVKQWLQEEELINQNIPKFMFDKNYLYVDEFGKIMVE